MFVSARDELEEQVRGLGFEGEVADLVDLCGYPHRSTSDATALFPADAVPSSHDGSTLGSGDYRRATVTYTDPSGREVDTASPGGHVTTTEYDRFGNTVREMTAADRELALATGASGLAEQQQLGIDALSSADRAQLLSTVSVFNAATSVVGDAGTGKDTETADAGQREPEKSGPLHMVTPGTSFWILMPASGCVGAALSVMVRRGTGND